MSKTIYSIKYDDDSFFSSDPNVIATFPFNLSDVLTWAKTSSLDSYLPADYDTQDLFDEKLSNVIISNKDSFINDFLKNNAYFTSEFSSVKVSTQIETSDTPESDQPSVNINGVSYKGTKVKSRNGSTSFVIGKPGFQRVNFQPTCTLNHLHFPGQNGCGVQRITNISGTYYKCVCSGTPIFDASPHSHCTEFTNNIKNAQSAYKSSYSSRASISSMMSRYKTSRNGNSANANANADDGDGDSSNINEMQIDYSNTNSLKDMNLILRELIYNYYCAVKLNTQYKNSIEARQKKLDTQNTALLDSTVKYKNEYLTAFNLLSGIIIVAGYIYETIKY